MMKLKENYTPPSNPLLALFPAFIQPTLNPFVR